MEELLAGTVRYLPIDRLHQTLVFLENWSSFDIWIEGVFLCIILLHSSFKVLFTFIILWWIFYIKNFCCLRGLDYHRAPLLSKNQIGFLVKWTWWVDWLKEISVETRFDFFRGFFCKNY
jgi:hypothetical protein